METLCHRLRRRRRWNLYLMSPFPMHRYSFLCFHTRHFATSSPTSTDWLLLLLKVCLVNASLYLSSAGDLISSDLLINIILLWKMRLAKLFVTFVFLVHNQFCSREMKKRRKTTFIIPY